MAEQPPPPLAEQTAPPLAEQPPPPLYVQPAPPLAEQQLPPPPPPMTAVSQPPPSTAISQPPPMTAVSQIGLSGQQVQMPTNFPPPPRQQHQQSMSRPQATDGDIRDPTHYTRDPKRLIVYLVPFPKPNLPSAAQIPDRFLIYTPPPPPLAAPKEGDKEDKVSKMQRKWQEEVRQAKTSNAKITSWQGMKGRATKGINTAIKHTTTSSLDFMNRIPTGSSSESKDSDVKEGDDTSGTVALEEMVLVYPTSLPGDEAQIREEFVNSMLRTKSKAQRDSIIATGLMPVALGVDILATVVWPFGGLAEIDGVWAYSSMRGAKTARSVSKRLGSSDTNTSGKEENQLKLSFIPSERIEVLRRYLIEQAHQKNGKSFPSGGPPPSESNVLGAIGWEASTVGGETKNWEDEQWELSEVKEDVKSSFGKAANEWDKWCKAFEKDPEKALKKG